MSYNKLYHMKGNKMLENIKLNPLKIEKWNNNLDNCIKEHGDKEGYFKEKKINPNDAAYKHLKDHPPGFYHLPFSCSPLPLNSISDYEIKDEFYSFMPKDLEELRILSSYNSLNSIRANFGVCDNYHQILKEYPELESEDCLFIVDLSLITKKNSPDWRWHKWGKYLGDYKPQAEYIKDEDIEEVIIFHIYEIIDNSNNK
ncbi:MAG: hypothetical protein GY870_08995 [archaeon]|nr:hypothetical protein [archaeon]